MKNKLINKLQNKLYSKMHSDYAERIKDLKIWTDLHSPELLKTALSYALDWLSPELIGTGFTVTHSDEQKIVAVVPFKKTNCDFQNQIHPGLVVNAGFEMIHLFLAKHWPKSAWQIPVYTFEMSKTLKWTKDLTLSLSVSEEEIDQILVHLQKNNEVDFEGTVFIAKKDWIKFKVNVKATQLLT